MKQRGKGISTWDRMFVLWSNLSFVCCKRSPFPLFMGWGMCSVDLTKEGA